MEDTNTATITATNTTTTTTTPLVLYDISSPLTPPRSYAPNPTKARLALNFKRAPFTTKFIDLLDIPRVRQSLSCAATRKLDDGSDYFTLPMVHDPSSNTCWGDTFAIANALEDLYPGVGGDLFPSHATGHALTYQSPHKDTPFYAPLTTNAGAKNEQYAVFNLHVDATFTAYVILVAQRLPFNADTAEECKTMFAKRAHLGSWDDLKCEGQMREGTKKAFREALGGLAELFGVRGGGVFLEGEKANHADLIVGGWLNYYAELLPGDEWEEMRGWHGGLWGRLYDVLRERYL